MPYDGEELEAVAAPARGDEQGLMLGVMGYEEVASRAGEVCHLVSIYVDRGGDGTYVSQYQHILVRENGRSAICGKSSRNASRYASWASMGMGIPTFGTLI